MRFGEGGDRGIVVDEDGDADTLGQLLAQRYALKRDVDRRPRGACCEVDDARHADADRVSRSGVVDRRRELGDERLAGGLLGGLQDGIGEDAVLQDGH
jgi:hypothetical protein